MVTTTHFATTIYEDSLEDDALVAALAHSIRTLAQDDGAGRRWSRERGYRGYTSYASLNDLPARDPAFADLKRVLDRHVAAYAREAGFELTRKLRLDSLWVNLLRPGGAHSGHIHPHSAVSGTLWIEAPPGAGAIRFEDPRLPLMMAAPLRAGTFVTVDPAPGKLALWESWLRHEVLPHGGKGERLSVSFNYA